MVVSFSLFPCLWKQGCNEGKDKHRHCYVKSAEL